MVKKAILDTSFILSAVEKKIDFFEELEMLGYKTVIPIEVVEELEGIAKGKQKKLKFRDLAEIALNIVKNSDFEEVALGHKNVDRSILNYANENDNVIIGTLDREIKNSFKGNKIVIRGRMLEVV